jgi:DtxR family transcriptional regulator, Mn-dependent transcriptional regulator
MSVASITEQNYLKAIYKLSHAYGRPEAVSTGDLATELATTAATVTDTLQRLARKRWVEYERYRGVTLTPEGHGIAGDLIRLHRLWEVFLVEKLGYAWHEVHPIAEQLEHVYHEDLAERLGEYLGNPTHDPHGDPIIGNNDQDLVALSELDEGAGFVISRVDDQDPAWLIFAAEQGLVPGQTGRLMRIRAVDGVLEIQLGRKSVFLGKSSVERVLVKPNETNF